MTGATGQYRSGAAHLVLVFFNKQGMIAAKKGANDDAFQEQG
jgi:hypothetical protein